MKKIDSFNSGSIWLNVFETDDGKKIVTINKSYTRRGAWKSTPFFNIDSGDMDDVKIVIEQLEESVNEVVAQQ